MRRSLVAILKVIGVGLAMTGLAVGACLVLVEPKPATLPARAWRWLMLRSGPPVAVAPASPGQPQTPFEAGALYSDVTAATGTGHLQKGHGVAFADWDRDGDLDIFLESGGATPGDRAHNVLFQNPGHGHHWLTVRLIGTKTNRAALGAKIRVDLAAPDGARTSRYRTITAGSSFGGNPFACTIGLGQAATIRALEVFWPTSGMRQTFSEVPVDRSIEITEGRDPMRVLEAPPLRLP